MYEVYSTIKWLEGDLILTQPASKVLGFSTSGLV